MSATSKYTTDKPESLENKYLMLASKNGSNLN